MRLVHPSVKSSKKRKLSLKCPFCNEYGQFELVGNEIVGKVPQGNKYSLGSYICPNSDCNSHVFIVDRYGDIITHYPKRIIDFETEEIPDEIVNSFGEALLCYSHNLYTSAAIMIRRTLEELCTNQNAKGSNLKQKIKNLENEVILPPPLFDGLDNLRLLGNDAAHVESRDYKNIGKDEVNLAIDVTKEVLKAVYQLDNLVERLSNLREDEE